MNQRDQLSAVLGYKFKKPALLEQALTHSSAAHHISERLDSNERLEFLGDRALGLVVAEWLFNRFPKEEEGALARRFASLVRRESLVIVAREIDLGAYLILNKADENTTGHDNPSVLADACEALIGALYLDGGLAPTQHFIETYWQSLIEADINPPQDSKTALQEWAQGKGLPLPVYHEVNREGPSHAPIFTIEVTVETLPPMLAEGTSKRIAEQVAAERTLEIITSGDDPDGKNKS
jgi:ribonuclease III